MLRSFQRIFILTLMLSGAALQARAEVQVYSLFDARSRAPGALIPIKVAGDGVTAGSIELAKIESHTGSDCRLMRDKFHGTIYLIRCKDAAEVKLQFRVRAQGETFNITYGPLSVVSPNSDLIVVNPDKGMSPVTRGKQLFNAYCVNCHNPPNVLRGRTPLQIRMAIQAQPLMNGSTPATGVDLRERTDDELSAISAYLKSL